MARKSNIKTPKLFLRPILILGTIVLGVILWYSLPRAISPNINVIGTPSGTTTLTLAPSTISTMPGVESILTLSLDAGTTHVTAVQIELNYDSSKIGVPIVTLGTFLPVVFNPVTTTGNKIAFTVATPPTSGGVTGSGTIATIKITPQVVGSSTLTFTDTTAVSNTEADELGIGNTLRSTNDVKVTIANTAIPSVLPSASPSVPSPLPSPIRPVIAIIDPTPTPQSSTPRPTVKPTSQPTVKPTISPTSTPTPPSTTMAINIPSYSESGSLIDISADPGDLGSPPISDDIKPLTFWEKIISWLLNIFAFN